MRNDSTGQMPGSVTTTNRRQAPAPSEASALKDRRVTRLFEDAHGSLWVGHDSGAIARFHDGTFHKLLFS